MPAVATIRDEILEWKTRRRALIVAHRYQDPEIQELADVVADGLELATAARHLQGDVIALCGVRFLAEIAKVLNPEKIVVVPDLHAGCSLADSCPAEAIRAFRRRNPRHVVVSYINTSIEVKAESDILCTASNAVKVVNSIPAHKPILFVPDINLGNYVQAQTGRKNMQIWQGACILHATLPGRRLAAARVAHPAALVAAHPECPGEILRVADFIGSAAAIVAWCADQSAREFIILCESGLRYSLEKSSPGKQFHFVENENCNCSECPYMRMNTLQKLLASLETLQPRIELAADVIKRVRVPLDRMFAAVN